MSKKNTTLRIDELLRFEGLVTEEQIGIALEYQREHGGRLGSHLVRLGYVEEADLLAALSKQFGCESVILANVDISADITALVPPDVAVARSVIPFDYDREENVLKVACEDPTDKILINELNFVAGSKNVKLYIAAEMALRAAVAKHYLIGVQPELSKSMASANDQDLPVVELSRGAVLLVSDEAEADRMLCQVLKHENYELTVTETADEAIDIIGGHAFHTVFVRDTVQGDYLDLIDQMRKLSPRTKVKFFESPAQLLIDGGSDEITTDLVVKNLQLLTTMLSSKEGLDVNHAGTVGHHTDRLCRKIGLPDKDRVSIVTAAYLHDISRFYYGESEDAPDCRSRTALTSKLLASLNYSPLVIGILQAMYINLGGKFTKRLPIEKLGGNIITMVDMFCAHFSMDSKMSLDKFEVIRNKLTALSGKLFMSEVLEAFLGMLDDEILVEPVRAKHNQVLLLSDSIEQSQTVAQRLKVEGFRTVLADSVDRFVSLYLRSRPDIMILICKAGAEAATSLVNQLVSRQVEMVKVPTFLLISEEVTADLTPLFKQGIEDIIPMESNLDLVVVKLRKLRDRVESRAAEGAGGSEDGVTGGKIEEMSLIDLLQALGPSRKTARIRITSGEQELLLFLSNGNIVFAEAGDTLGAEAVYAGIAWTEGSWRIEPVPESDLPVPNIASSNEHILIEGCRRLDEQARVESGKSPSASMPPVG